MIRSTWLSLLVAAGLAIALPGAVRAQGCCQYSDSCEKTEDAKACEDKGGHHYQLGVCDGKTCHPTVAGDPRPIGQTASAFPFSALAEPLPPHATAAGFDCVTKSGDFCWGELGKGNQCVSSTTCTSAQLAECLPGFPRCPKEVEPAPAPFPEY